MTARQKIEWLTNSWYGYELVTGALTLLRGSWGPISIFFNLLGLGIGLAITFWLGRSLMNRSSLTRALLAIVSVISIGFGGLFLVFQGWGLWSSVTFAGLFNLGLTLAGLTLNLRSYRVLTDSSVKAYVGG